MSVSVTKPEFLKLAFKRERSKSQTGGCEVFLKKNSLVIFPVVAGYYSVWILGNVWGVCVCEGE